MSKMRSPSSTHRLPNGILRSSVSSPVPILSGPMAKPHTRNKSWEMEDLDTRPEYRSISCEFRALAKMIEHEFGNRKLGNTVFPDYFTANSISVFEKGRLYDEYSARRNERLKGKRSGERKEDSRKSVCNLGVNNESGKKRDLKKFGNLRKSVPANFSISGSTEIPRYPLRVRSNSKANEEKKKQSSISLTAVVGGVRKAGAPRILKT